ncbi:MAG: sensor histidine kinase [Candidatus Dadabacteria bacterium]
MNIFLNNKFLFSDERKYRIQRHVVFWIFWGLYFSLAKYFNPKTLKETGHFPDLFKTMAEAFLLLLPQAILVYPFLYFILPRYVFRGKYFKASLWTVVFLVLTIAFSAALLIVVPWHKVMWITSQTSLFKGVSGIQKWGLAYLSALQGSLTGAALAASLKMFKYYYLKNLRNLQLQKENTDAQMQLLTAQVHPHFLFNTLNNIYSQTQLESPIGSKMIMGLSDILRYILYEGQKPLVPLKQELSMINEYINLEKIRYGNKLDVHVLVTGKPDNLYIAPLLILPFVENCFKHGTSKILQRPWINFTIELKDTTLVMKLMNGKVASKGEEQGKAGIGINNVRQRLNLLYTNKYDLQIREEEEVFVVDLKVQLIRDEHPPQNTVIIKPEAEYA